MDPVTVKSLTYHTINSVEPHPEHEEYSVTDPALLSNLIVCGFVDAQGWTPEPPPAATGATAGTPGTWTPSGATPPASNQNLGGITATPSTVWTVGQYVVCADASEAYWNGAAWAVGRAT